MHQEKCIQPDGQCTEVVWCDFFNDQFNRRMKHFRKHFWQYVPGPYLEAQKLKEECSKEKVKKMSVSEKVILADKIYKAVGERHGNAVILDIGVSSVQPRINTKFKKKKHGSIEH